MPWPRALPEDQQLGWARKAGRAGGAELAGAEHLLTGVPAGWATTRSHRLAGFYWVLIILIITTTFTSYASLTGPFHGHYL